MKTGSSNGETLFQKLLRERERPYRIEQRIIRASEVRPGMWVQLAELGDNYWLAENAFPVAWAQYQVMIYVITNLTYGKHVLDHDAMIKVMEFIREPPSQPAGQKPG